MLDPIATPPAGEDEASAAALAVLDEASIRAALALQAWLLDPAMPIDEGSEILTGFAERLIAAGIPVDRVMIAMDALHTEYSGIGRSWTREDGPAERFFAHGGRTSDIYLKSPFYHVHQTGRWLYLDLAETPDDRFNILPDLKQAGYRHYIVVPVVFGNGAENGIALATRAPQGFSARDRAFLRVVLPAFAALLEIRAAHKWLDDVLRVYVGDEPHREILSGAIQRGQMTRIRSDILVADMRNYTTRSSTQSPEETVAMLNTLFDCLVPPIEAEGGEVLKYMGDGLLAIFRDRGDDTGGTASAAFTAARAGLAGIRAANERGAFADPVHVGYALHHGEAAYGNVGAGQRLDFTVIGRDVNLVSRIAQLNRPLGEPLLMSKAFADRLWGSTEWLGSHALHGFAEPVPVYRPAG